LDSVPHQVDFVMLQLELLNEFHHDLTDFSKIESNRQPLSGKLAAYLNTAIYVATVASEWGDQTVSKSLQHYFWMPLGHVQVVPLVGPGQLCRHNLKHNRKPKASGMMLA